MPLVLVVWSAIMVDMSDISIKWACQSSFICLCCLLSVALAVASRSVEQLLITRNWLKLEITFTWTIPEINNSVNQPHVVLWNLSQSGHVAIGNHLLLCTQPWDFRQSTTLLRMQNSDKIDNVLHGPGDTRLVILMDNASMCTKLPTRITCTHHGASNGHWPTS